MARVRKKKKNNTYQKALSIKRKTSAVSLSTFSTRIDWIAVIGFAGIFLIIIFSSAYITYQKSESVNALGALETQVVTKDDKTLDFDEESYLKIIEDYKKKSSRFEQLSR